MLLLRVLFLSSLVEQCLCNIRYDLKLGTAADAKWVSNVDQPFSKVGDDVPFLDTGFTMPIFNRAQVGLWLSPNGFVSFSALPPCDHFCTIFSTKNILHYPIVYALNLSDPEMIVRNASGTYVVTRPGVGDMPLFAGYLDDLDPTSKLNPDFKPVITFLSSETSLIIQFKDVPIYNAKNNTALTMQMHFHKNGTIASLYKSVPPESASGMPFFGLRWTRGLNVFPNKTWTPKSGASMELLAVQDECANATNCSDCVVKTLDGGGKCAWVSAVAGCVRTQVPDIASELALKGTAGRADTSAGCEPLTFRDGVVAVANMTEAEAAKNDTHPLFGMVVGDAPPAPGTPTAAPSSSYFVRLRTGVPYVPLPASANVVATAQQMSTAPFAATTVTLLPSLDEPVPHLFTGKSPSASSSLYASGPTPWREWGAALQWGMALPGTSSVTTTPSLACAYVVCGFGEGSRHVAYGDQWAFFPLSHPCNGFDGVSPFGTRLWAQTGDSKCTRPAPAPTPGAVTVTTEDEPPLGPGGTTPVPPASSRSRGAAVSGAVSRRTFYNSTLDVLHRALVSSWFDAEGGTFAATPEGLKAAVNAAAEVTGARFRADADDEVDDISLQQVLSSMVGGRASSLETERAGVGASVAVSSHDSDDVVAAFKRRVGAVLEKGGVQRSRAAAASVEASTPSGVYTAVLPIPNSDAAEHVVEWRALMAAGPADPFPESCGSKCSCGENHLIDLQVRVQVGDTRTTPSGTLRLRLRHRGGGNPQRFYSPYKHVSGFVSESYGLATFVPTSSLDGTMEVVMYPAKGCPDNCGGGITGRGSCYAGTGRCVCGVNATGDSCGDCVKGHWGPLCVACSCSGHGRCAEGANSCGACTCDNGFAGLDCSQAVEGQCPAYTAIFPPPPEGPPPVNVSSPPPDPSPSPVDGAAVGAATPPDPPVSVGAASAKRDSAVWEQLLDRATEQSVSWGPPYSVTNGPADKSCTCTPRLPNTLHTRRALVLQPRIGGVGAGGCPTEPAAATGSSALISQMPAPSEERCRCAYGWSGDGCADLYDPCTHHTTCSDCMEAGILDDAKVRCTWCVQRRQCFSKGLIPRAYEHECMVTSPCFVGCEVSPGLAVTRLPLAPADAPIPTLTPIPPMEGDPDLGVGWLALGVALAILSALGWVFLNFLCRRRPAFEAILPEYKPPRWWGVHPDHTLSARAIPLFPRKSSRKPVLGIPLRQLRNTDLVESAELMD